MVCQLSWRPSARVERLVSAYVCRRPGGRRIAFAMDGTVLASELHRVHRAQARGMQYLLIPQQAAWCGAYSNMVYHICPTLVAGIRLVCAGGWRTCLGK